MYCPPAWMTSLPVVRSFTRSTEPSSAPAPRLLPPPLPPIDHPRGAPHPELVPPTTVLAARAALDTDRPTRIDLAAMERDASWLTMAQIASVATAPGLAARSPRLAQLAKDAEAIEAMFSRFGSADEEARTFIARGVDTLTPQMQAKLMAVLLTGSLTQHLKDDLRWLWRGFTDGVGGLIPKMPRENLRGLQRLFSAISARDPAEREPFLRAVACELAAYDEELVHRLVTNIGAGAIAALLPDTPDSATVDEVAEALCQQGPVMPYLRRHCAAPEVATYAPSAATRACAAAAAAAIDQADDFARSKHIDQSAAGVDLARANELYGEARAAVRATISSDPLAIRDPVVKGWMRRRARALFIRSALDEITESVGKEKTGRLVDWLGRQVPGIGGLFGPPGATQPALLRHLEAELGFSPLAARTGERRAALMQAIERLTMAAGPDDDPMTGVLLAPEPADSPEHIHLVFAPGVVPIAGVLDGAFARLRQRNGVAVHVAATGLFESEYDNAAAVAGALNEALTEDPAARVVMIGYSQGVPNLLRCLHDLRNGTTEDRRRAERVRAIGSVYGAHNGSPAADTLLPTLRGATWMVPFTDRIEVGLSSYERVGRLFGGGVNSLKRKTRSKFWDIANLPTDIPYTSLTAHPDGRESVPMMLAANYDAMKQTAKALGLPEDNDTQVLACDAPMGCDRSEVGRAIRSSNTNLDLRGHHWNVLDPEHVPIDSPETYWFPKTPQIEAHVQMLAELGLLDPKRRPD